MHCVDCHFVQDIHGNAKLYGEPRNAIEIQCVDCHGTRREAAPTLRHDRPRASAPRRTKDGRGTDLLDARRFGEPRARFEVQDDGKLSSRTRWSSRACSGR